MKITHPGKRPINKFQQFHRGVVLTLIALLFTTNAMADSRSDKAGAISIKNFGQVDERVYRGAQPKPEEFQDLARLGVKTVIDLRDDSEAYEKAAAETAGLRYVHIPMNAKHPPTDAQVEEFLKTLNDPASGKLFVHCAGGRHRTGVMVAVYRFARYHWSPQQAYAEMEAYDFYTRWGHGDMKDYVLNYKVKSEDVVSLSTSLKAAENAK